VGTLVGSDASHAGTGSERAAMRHAPVFEEAASGLWTRGRNALERARASRNQIWLLVLVSRQSSGRTPKHYSPFDTSMESK
jgi:hypothetical protein